MRPSYLLTSVLLFLMAASFAAGQERMPAYPPRTAPAPLPPERPPTITVPPRTPASPSEIVIPPTGMAEPPMLPERPAPLVVARDGSKPDAPPPPVAGTTPVVTLELLGPESANVGVPVPYELIVRNVGKVPVFQVRVEQDLPPNVRYIGGEPQAEIPGDRLQWTIGILDGGTEKRIRFRLQAAGEGDLRARATVTYSFSAGVTTKVTRPKLTLTMTGPEAALVGEEVSFQIRLANTGNGPIGKLMLRDRIPDGLKHPNGNLIEADLGTLAAGEVRTITLKLTATRSGEFTNVVEAFAEGSGSGDGLKLVGFNNPDLSATARAEVRVREPGLRVRLGGAKHCLVRGEVSYFVEVSNPGTAPTGNVRVADRIPDGTDFVSAGDGGTFDPATRTVSWQIDTLESGAIKNLPLRVRATTAGEGRNTATVAAGGGLTGRAELPLRIEGIPALMMEVVDLDDPVAVGGEAHYEIRVVNQGTCACSNIQIVATLPEGMEIAGASGPTPYRMKRDQIVFEPMPKLATRADVVYRLRVRGNIPADVRFRVQLVCDQLQLPVTKEESTRFYRP